MPDLPDQNQLKKNFPPVPSDQVPPTPAGTGAGSGGSAFPSTPTPPPFFKPSKPEENLSAPPTPSAEAPSLSSDKPSGDPALVDKPAAAGGLSDPKPSLTGAGEKVIDSTPPPDRSTKPVWMSPTEETPSAPSSSPLDQIPEPASPGVSSEPELPTPIPAAPVQKPSSGKIKKIIPLFLFLVVVAALAGLVFRFVLPRFKVAQKPAELVYWGLWEPENVMQGIIADWEKENPNIKIRYEQHSPKEYRERLQSALARGEGPDVFRFHNTWVPMLKNELDSVPASVMDAATFERTYYPAAAKSLRLGANFAGVPMEIDTLALFYNQDIFTAAGVTVPKTWDELRELALKLTLKDQDGKLQRGGVALGTTGNIWHWSDILGLMMIQNGADLARPTGQLAEDALAFYVLFSETDEVWDETLPASIFAFATGKVAMAFGFSWDVFEIQNINPSLNFKVAPVPQLAGTDLAWASFWTEGVAKKSPDKEAAWEFVKYLTSKNTMEKLYQAEARLRLFGEPYARVEMAGLLQNDSMVAPFINQAPKAQSWYLCSRTFDNGINDRIIKYYEDAVNAVNSRVSPTDALSTAAQGISQVLSQYELSAAVSQ